VTDFKDDPKKPLKSVLAIVKYAAADGLGYKNLKIAAGRVFSDGKLTHTSIMVTMLDGEKELKVIQERIDATGKTHDRLTFENDKKKLAAVEQRIADVLKACAEAISK
jgi:hypothetical protein